MSNSAPSGSTAATRDERFDILADASASGSRDRPGAIARGNREKRLCVHGLAAVISDTRIAAVSEDEHQRALVEFHHRLVPQLVAAGFLAETDDGSVVPAEQSPFDDPRPRADRFGEPRCRSGDARCGVPRTRRRTPADGPVGTERSIPIPSGPKRSLEMSRLAKPRRPTGRFPGPHRRYRGLTRACPPSPLADATLIGYDDETGRVSYEGNPAVRAEWIQPADDVTTTDDAAADGTATTSTDVRIARRLSPGVFAIDSDQSVRTPRSPNSLMRRPRRPSAQTTTLYPVGPRIPRI